MTAEDAQGRSFIAEDGPHACANRSGRPARIAFVLVDAGGEG